MREWTRGGSLAHTDEPEAPKVTDDLMGHGLPSH